MRSLIIYALRLLRAPQGTRVISNKTQTIRRRLEVPIVPGPRGAYGKGPEGPLTFLSLDALSGNNGGGDGVPTSNGPKPPAQLPQ
jgi:hypothetical protein